MTASLPVGRPSEADRDGLGRPSYTFLGRFFAGLVVSVVLFGAAAPPTSEPSSDWRQRLQQMSPAEKQKLQEKQDRFYRLEPGVQDRLRKLHADLSSDPQAERLGNVMDQYTAWLKTLPSGQRADLLSLPAQDRVAEIQRLMKERKASEMGRFVARKLKEEDATAIAQWMEEVVKKREPEILRKVPTMVKEALDRHKDPKQRARALAFAAHHPEVGRELLRPTPDEFERLKSVLSPEARQELEKAKQEGRLPALAEGWMKAVAFSQWWAPAADPGELRQFYNTVLTAADREYLESLPPERMRVELRRRFHLHRLRESGEYVPPFPFKGGAPRGWPRSWSGDRRPDRGPPGPGGPEFPREKPPLGPRGKAGN